MRKLLNKNVLFGVLVFLLIIPSFISLVRQGYFPMQDDIQAFRIYEMDKCFKDFQIPCRWVPDMGYEYGYPQFNYYAPLPYYVGEIFHLAGFQFIDVVKILFILGFILGAFLMYIFVKDFLGEVPAVVSSVLYTYVPYKATQVYVRGSLSEFWVLAFFPLAFWASKKFIEKKKLKHFIWFAVSVFLIITTHNLMFIVFFPILLAWIIYFLWVEGKKNLAKPFVISGLLGIGLSCFFLLPVVFERQFAHLNSLLGGYFDYRQHFVSLKQLFFSNHFGYGSSELGPNDDLSLSVGILHWILSALAGILSFINFNKNKKLSGAAFLLLGLSLPVLFLMHAKSTFIWEDLAFLKWFQFPWRLLGITSFLFSILGGIAIYFAGKYKVYLSVVVLVILFVLHGSFFKPRAWMNISDSDKFSGQSWEKQLTISIFDYLPIYATLPPNAKAPDLPEVLKGEANFLSYKKGSDYQEGTVNVLKQATLRVPLFYFPGMKATIDNMEVPIAYNNCDNEEYCLGLISFNVPEGEHKIKVVLTDTPVRTIGNLLTIVSTLSLIYLGFFKNGKIKKRLY